MMRRGLSRPTVSSQGGEEKKNNRKNSPAFSSGTEFVKRGNQVEIN